MIGDTFVFDAVLHVSDMSSEGLVDGPTPRGGADVPGGMDGVMDMLKRLTGGVADLSMHRRDDGSYDLPPEFHGSIEAIYDWMFVQTPTDMAMAGNQPIAPSAIQLDPERHMQFLDSFVKAYPERLLFGGGTDPLGMGISPAMGLDYALDSIERQVREFGATSMKFYPMAWSCDDKEVAYPMFEKCRSEGIKVLQFHKNIPVFLENVETQRPNDLQAPARDFPDMTFLMHHPMRLYFEETVSIAQRFPNFHLLLTPLIHFSLVKPRLAQEQLGYLLQQVGSEKLSWGSEGLIVGNTTRYLEAFMDLEIPKDLRVGYGYPQVTDEDRANILGLNFARMFNIDVEAKKRELAGLPVGR